MTLFSTSHFYTDPLPICLVIHESKQMTKMGARAYASQHTLSRYGCVELKICCTICVGDDPQIHE